MSRSFYTGTDKQMADGSANFKALITAEPTTYGLVAAQATAYGVLDTAYQTNYRLATEPSTRTPVAVENKNLARRALKANAILLASIIRSTPTVTNAQLVALGLSVRTIPTPIPPPAIAPEVDVVSVNGRTVKIRVHDAESTRRKAPGARSATVFSHLGATPPANINEWKYEGVSTKTVCDVIFADTVAAGSLVWITAIWANNRAQSGPAADPVSINIAGGGVSTLAA